MILTIYSLRALILAAWELQLPINSSVNHEMQVHSMCVFFCDLLYIALHFAPFNMQNKMRVYNEKKTYTPKSNNSTKWFFWNHLKINEGFFPVLVSLLDIVRMQTIMHLQSIMTNKCLLIFQLYGAHPSQSCVIFYHAAFPSFFTLFVPHLLVMFEQIFWHGIY